MKVVTLVPGGIGDQILFFPTIADLKRHRPDAEIDVVVEPRSKSAYGVCEYVRNVITFDFKERNGFADIANFIGIIRNGEYDVALSLGSSPKVAFLLWLTGISTRIGYQSSASWLLTKSVPLKKEQYAAAMYHDLLKGLDINTPCPPISVSIPQGDRDWAKVEQQKLGLNPGYILIHGGSSQLAKNKGIDKIYPAKKWQQVIYGIQQRDSNAQIVVIKGPEDQDFVAELSQVIPGLKTTSPQDIGKLAAMIAGAKVMICTDSAPMHLSIGVGTKTLAVFGPTDAKKLLPDSDRAIAIQSRTGSLADLTPAEIIEKLFIG
jgi:ADP-heptose:LPS heptosyltransferase